MEGNKCKRGLSSYQEHRAVQRERKRNRLKRTMKSEEIDEVLGTFHIFYMDILVIKKLNVGVLSK